MRGTCSKCNAEDDFASSNISRITGKRLYRSWCLGCEKKRKADWCYLNKEKHNARSRKWVSENPEKRKIIAKNWVKKNYDSVLLAKQNWRKNNLQKAKAYVNARRKSLRTATPKCLNEFDVFFIAEIYHLAQLRRLTVDHIVPLRHKLVCGLHVPWNLHLMNANENYSKSNFFDGVATR